MPKTISKLPQVPVTRDPFQNLFHRLFQDMWSEYPATEVNQSPLANISETADAYELAFELPGLEEKDINVQVEDQTLTVTAERKDDREGAEADRKWHRVEHRYGRFIRAISLPRDGKSDGIEAVYRQGVLTVRVPKAPEAQKKRIEVRGN